MAAPDAVSAAVATAQDVVDKLVCICGHITADHALSVPRRLHGRPVPTVCVLCAGECTRFRPVRLTVWATRDAEAVLEFLRELAVPVPPHARSATQARDYEAARGLLARLDR